MKTFRIPSSINSYFITYFVFVMMFYGIQYTVDLANYLTMVKHPELCPDFLLRGMLQCFGENIDFLSISRLHFILMGGAILLLIRRTVDCPIIAVLYAVSCYLYLVNQIRFYLALPLMLLAIFSLYKKEYFFFVLLATVSVLSHKTLILFLGAVVVVEFVIRRMNFWKAVLTLIGIAIGACLMVSFDWGTGFAFGKLRAYQELHHSATLLGAIYNLIPYSICLALIVNVHLRVKKNYPAVLEDLIYRYLLVVSLTPIVFLGFGFYLMVFTERFVLSMILIWMMYFYYCYKKYSDKILKEEIVIVFVVTYLISPLFSCVHSLIKGDFSNGVRLFKSLVSWSLF